MKSILNYLKEDQENLPPRYIMATSTLCALAYISLPNPTVTKIIITIFLTAISLEIKRIWEKMRKNKIILYSTALLLPAAIIAIVFTQYVITKTTHLL